MGAFDMKRFGLALARAVAAILLATPFVHATPPDVLQQAIDPNPTLQTYVATASLAAELHALVPVHETFVGTVYYQKPKRKIVFSNVSGALSKFKELATSTPSIQEIHAQYVTTLLSDDGKTSTYKLTPSQPGHRVTSLTLRIDDASELISSATWAYSNGGTLRFDQVYEAIGTYHLPSQENIAARFPGYSVDGVLKFTNYQPNAAVPASVFSGTS